MRGSAPAPTRQRAYLTLATALVVVYVAVATVLLATKDFGDQGPLSFHGPAREVALEGAITPADAAWRCFGNGPAYGGSVKVVGAVVRGRPYYACYWLHDDGNVEGRVIDGQGGTVKDAGLIKEAGAWPWVSSVDTPFNFAMGAAGLILVLGLGWLDGQRSRPTPTAWWSRSSVLFALALVPLVGWLVLYMLPDVDGAQRIRALLQAVFVFTGAIVFGILTMAASNGDTWALIVEGLLAVGVVLAVAGGWMLRPVSAA